MKKETSNPGTGTVHKKSLKQQIYYYRSFYIMFIPVFIFAVVFHYLPMLGIRYSLFSYKGIKAPEFIGLANFERMFSMPGFWSAFGNTILLSVVKLLLNTFMAVLISILLNELRFMKFKKVTQTIVYLPHFMSWVVTASVFTLILSPGDAGLVNSILIKLGIIDEGIYFLGDKEWWRSMFYAINIWKDTGWGTIIFMATLSGINPELYEAASMDGAKVMNLFESVFVLQNDAVIQKADVLQTYIYTQTFNSGALPDFGYTTAVSVTASVVGCILVLLCNRASYKVRGRGIV